MVFKLHVKEVETGGTRMEIEDSGNVSTGLDNFASEILAE